MDIQEMIKYIQELKITCLRCGECCRSYDVCSVPGYSGGMKPGGQLCKHCAPAKIVAGKWQQAGCGIHDQDNYPCECRNFKMVSPNGFCLLGFAIWQHQHKLHPEAELPDEVCEALGQSQERSEKR